MDRIQQERVFQELIEETEAIEVKWRALLAFMPSAKIEHYVDGLSWLLRAAAEVRGEAVGTRQEFIHKLMFQSMERSRQYIERFGEPRREK